ncbi:MAG: hypothetical protein WAM14_27070 [Candidatus Nitrosopolaris sp.]
MAKQFGNCLSIAAAFKVILFIQTAIDSGSRHAIGQVVLSSFSVIDV